MTDREHVLPQPDGAWIDLCASRIEHELLVLSGIDRRRDRDEGQRSQLRLDQTKRDEGHEIGARDDVQRLQIARHY